MAIEKTPDGTYGTREPERSAGHCLRHLLNDPSLHTGECARRIGRLG